MTYFDDNKLIEWRHSPELAFNKCVPRVFKGISIGWISNKIHRKGKLESHLFKKLETIANNFYIDQGYLGHHKCQIGFAMKCGQLGRGEFILIGKNGIYIMPKLILHYITYHEYLPPDNFISELQLYNSAQQFDTQDLASLGL